jgi:ATP-binding cassette subfamily F protein 3
MISFQKVSKHFGTQTVLADASFAIHAGDRMGIVGPNGAGKSTVFALLVGEMEPDGGIVKLPSDARIGYVHQQINPHKITATLLEYTENAVPEIAAMQAEIHEIEAQLHAETPGSRADGAEMPELHAELAEKDLSVSAPPRDSSSLPSRERATLLRRLGELQTDFEHMAGYELKNRAEQALCGLGFSVADLFKPFRSFSGGWQSRSELARILVARPEVLLLDEPSNYLDIPTIEWMQRYLKEFRGTLVLISHDRFLLNSLTTVTLEVANTKIERYPGNYDYYARERTLRFEQRLAAQKNQDRKREHIERFVERFRAKNTFSSQVQSRIKMLEKFDDIDLPQRIVSPGKIRLRPPPHCGVEVMRLEKAGISYDGQRWVLRGVDLSVMRGEKIGLVGLNGLGKTTLLRILAGKLPLSEGKRVLGHKVQIGYQSQDFADTMDPSNTVFGVIKGTAYDSSEQEIRSMLGSFGFSGNAIEKPVEVLSGGEKIRLAFARLLIRPPNFLILDEPTTHLDIQAREALEEALAEYQGTIVLVSHDIDFTRKVSHQIIAMTPPGITRYAGGYDYYHEKMEEAAERQQNSEVRIQKPVVGREQAGAKPILNSDSCLPAPTKKDLRKQRALERQSLYGQTKDLKKAIFKVEAEVDRLEKEKTELSAALSSPAEGVNIAVLGRRLQQVQYEIDIATTRWEKATAELEKAMGNAGGDQAEE